MQRCLKSKLLVKSLGCRACKGIGNALFALLYRQGLLQAIGVKACAHSFGDMELAKLVFYGLWQGDCSVPSDYKGDRVACARKMLYAKARLCAINLARKVCAHNFFSLFV